MLQHTELMSEFGVVRFLAHIVLIFTHNASPGSSEPWQPNIQLKESTP